MSNEASKGAYRSAFPEGFFLEEKLTGELESYLKSQGVLDEEDRLEKIEKAGQGNMNLTLRMVSGSGSFIAKQGRPWVEKYPAISAPPNRTAVEYLFYQKVRDNPDVSGFMPRLLGYDKHSGILFLSDEGSVPNFEFLYREGTLDFVFATQLGKWLGGLHKLWLDEEEVDQFSNMEMRKLNHAHIFSIPFNPDNGLDLEAIQPGLQKLANDIYSRNQVVAAAHALGKVYLRKDGEVLLHGDFYPGSWLQGQHQAIVIDPEFCYVGLPEFDLGVVQAHLYLADVSQSVIETFFNAYKRRYNRELTFKFAGVEVIRRLIGVAQLPLQAEIEQKAIWLDQASSWLVS